MDLDDATGTQGRFRAYAAERTAAQHQSLLHFVAQAPWSDQAMLRRVREQVLPSITRDEPLQAWIIDDTGFPKKVYRPRLVRHRVEAYAARAAG